MFANMAFYNSRQSAAVAAAPSEINGRMSGKYIKLKFTPDEDARLLELVQEYGPKEWITVASLMQTRNPRQCRERYSNYLNPNLRHDGWTAEEDVLLEQKYQEIGPKWNSIGKAFTNRSDNALRNRWMMMNRRRAGADSHISDAPRDSGPESQMPDVLPIPAEPVGATAEGILQIVDFMRPGTQLEEDTFDPWNGF
jgi:hypothetical protein